ncbi:hypothetical protein WH47_05577, partial [Habropoda laboriosa]
FHYSFLKPGTTVAAESYSNELQVVYQKLKVQQQSINNSYSDFYGLRIDALVIRYQKCIERKNVYFQWSYVSSK